MKRAIAMLSVASAALLGGATLWAQAEVGPLKDLVGAKGRDGETQMLNRGYQLAGASQAGDSSFTYWREPRSSRCVAVRTTEGRYASITYAKEADCQGSGASAPAAGGDSFQTVCGVETGGKTYRYRCTVRNEGCQGEGFCRTTMTMPDNEIELTWLKNDQVEVEATGTVPAKTTSMFRDGQTRFEYGGNTYFLYRSPERAKRELANFKD